HSDRGEGIIVWAFRTWLFNRRLRAEMRRPLMLIPANRMTVGAIVLLVLGILTTVKSTRQKYSSD
ncbi:MAG TPA: hypothetical protein VL285_19970, partial [Bryobacteraceae bacterium]|nr:hypothetical protein [Bryobacteraceae bacterium]